MKKGGGSPNILGSLTGVIENTPIYIYRCVKGVTCYLIIGSV